LRRLPRRGKFSSENRHGCPLPFGVARFDSARFDPDVGIGVNFAHRRHRRQGRHRREDRPLRLRSGQGRPGCSLADWSHPDGPNDVEERFVTVLEIPPVESARTAVQALILSDIKKRKK